MRLLAISTDKKGFTLVEILIVISITLILASISIPIYGNLQQSSQLNEVTSNLLQDIREVRSRSANGLNGSRHGIYFDNLNKNYVLYQGDDYSNRNVVFDIVIEYSNSIFITSDLNGNEINFSKGLAEPSDNGVININHQTGAERDININNSGYAEEN